MSDYYSNAKLNWFRIREIFDGSRKLVIGSASLKLASKYNSPAIICQVYFSLRLLPHKSIGSLTFNIYRYS